MSIFGILMFLGFIFMLHGCGDIGEVESPHQEQRVQISASTLIKELKYSTVNIDANNHVMVDLRVPVLADSQEDVARFFEDEILLIHFSRQPKSYDPFIPERSQFFGVIDDITMHDVDGAMYNTASFRLSVDLQPKIAAEVAGHSEVYLNAIHKNPKSPSSNFYNIGFTASVTIDNSFPSHHTSNTKHP